MDISISLRSASNTLNKNETDRTGYFVPALTAYVLHLPTYALARASYHHTPAMLIIIQSYSVLLLF